jgi:hypothetical protein
MAQRPIAGHGFRQARRFWKLVVASWLGGLVLQLPSQIVVHRGIAAGWRHLPLHTMPQGEIALILCRDLADWMAPLLALTALSLVGCWLWTVLWHAGVVSWHVWVGGRVVRLGEVLGLGVSAWLRYLRLSVTAGSALLLGVVLIWVSLGYWLYGAWQEQDGFRLLTLLGLGFGFSVLAAIFSWAAVLWGAWLLGMPGSRSAAVAWWHGLVSTWRHPMVTFSCLGRWLFVAGAAALLPVLLPWQLATLRGPISSFVTGAAGGLALAYCWVGLFLSFAPVSGFSLAEAEAAVKRPLSDTAALRR